MLALLGRFVLVTPVLLAQMQVLPVTQLRPDMQGVARTVFRGQEPEDFPLQILGVMRNSGPGQNIILARLLTERLEQTGVMQGMSGSPVYVEGKLVGAIAFAFPFAKEPIAGIRPIDEMLASGARANPLRVARVALGSETLIAGGTDDPREGPQTVFTPVSVGGFTAATIEHFAGQWRRLGLVLQQGGGGSAGPGGGSVKPGDMISVQLMRGDLNAGADGTVTHVDGNKIFAFGHRFLGGGAVEFPFAKAEVITPLANLNQPFKISQSLSTLGTIGFDGDAAITGELGRTPRVTPVRIRYRDERGESVYQTEMARHGLLSPLLLQMAVFSTLDHHFRSAGLGTVDLKMEVKYPGESLPLRVEGRYAGDSNLPIAASLGAAIPVAYLQQNAEEATVAEAVNVELDARPSREAWVIEHITAGNGKAKPGERVTIRTRLGGAGGTERVIETPFVIPAWLEGGQTLTVTVADGFTTNLLDFRSFYQPGGPVFRSTRDLIETLNRLHPANALYVRAFRASPGFQAGGQELGNLPPSIAVSLQKNPGTYLPLYQSRLLDREVRLTQGIVAGSKSLTLEIEK